MTNNLSILTFGNNCVIKEYIKNYLGLNLYNTPFDWNITYDTSFIKILLENNFENFITEDLFPSPDFLKNQELTEKNHLTIHNKKYNFSFMHDNITNKNNICYYDTQEIISKYNRRIERLYENINNSDKIILLYNEKNISYYYPYSFCFENNQIFIDNEKTKKDFDELIYYLQNKYPNKEFKYYIINNQDNFNESTKNLLNELYLSNNILINGNKTDRTDELSKELNIN